MATELQSKVLRAVLTNNFMDGTRGTDRIGHPIWSDCIEHQANVPGCPTGKRLSGVVSTLVQAGLLGSDGECVWLTQEGYIVADATEWQPK